MKQAIILILHNIRSLHNVGSIFRTADAAGMSKIYLTGYTPSPFDKLGNLEPNFAKAALGSEKFVEHKKIKSIGSLITKLKRQKTQIAAIEQHNSSIIYTKFKPKFPVALILGNEVTGLEKSVLSKCDKIIEIPMHGQKESLNVSVAAGIVLFSLKN